MNRKFISDISASSVQVILNQLLGLAIFLLTSRYLGKAAYGELNWSLAVLTFITTILSLRLEQVVVSRVAAGQNASKMLTIFTGHILFSGITFYLLLLGASILFPAFFKKHDLLLILAISHLLSFFSSPFKQLANGKERFRSLAVMSSTANFIRSAWLLFVVIFSSLTIGQVITIYIISSFIELLVCFYISQRRLHVPFSIEYRLRDYFTLIKESLPLAGAVMLNASIARIDWIILGLFSSPEKTAEYSFAYKVFELSPFPLLILAPILLSRFSKFFSRYQAPDLLLKHRELRLLIRAEMIMATFIPLVLNMIWTPLIDSITENKYGAVNEFVFLILSCCIPFLYINNLLWSVHFAQNRLATIFRVTIVTFLIILGGDLLFIPLYNTRGAALVYLVATVIEYFNYMRTSFMSKLSDAWLSPFMCLTSAIASGLIAENLSSSLFIRLSIAIPLFIIFLAATKQLQKNDLRYIFRFFSKHETRHSV
jgi:O-antigen/teichoic acid export membrane protein